MAKRAMTLQEAVDLMADLDMDDLPDGAYWAIAHDLAEAEYGYVWHELDSYPGKKNGKSANNIKVNK